MKSSGCRRVETCDAQIAGDGNCRALMNCWVYSLMSSGQWNVPSRMAAAAGPVPNGLTSGARGGQRNGDACVHLKQA